MSRTLRRSPLWTAILPLGMALLSACSDGAPSPVAPTGQQRFSKGTSTSVSVTATTPSYGNPGEVGETVTITGSGFKPGAQATWLLLSDSVDTTIAVVSTQYVSSTQLTSVINISPNSPIAMRNVQVTNADRTQGIGNSPVFEVTQAVVIQGTQNARATNDNGEVTGTFAGSGGGPSYFSTATGVLQQVDTNGTGFDLSPMGNAIVGHSGVSYATLWTRPGAIGTAWQATPLPRDPTATGGEATTLVADPVTGQVAMIGGSELIPVSKNSSARQPRLWIWQSATSSWQRVLLPTGASKGQGSVSDLSANRIAVGQDNGQAALWAPNASGVYTLSFLAAGSSAANGINSAGTLIVGRTYAGNTSAAVYWQQLSGGGWSAPITLPGGCFGANDVSDAGRVVLNSCPFGNKSFPAFIDPPYTAPMQLSGLGPNNTIGQVSGISPSGQYITAQASVQSTAVGIYWKLF